MADVKHTPGEWTPEFGETYNVRAPDGGRVATCTNLKGRNGLGGRRTSIEVAANARLISAAPDLLEALIAAEQALEHAGSHLHADRCREVIAKATGAAA